MAKQEAQTAVACSLANKVLKLYKTTIGVVKKITAKNPVINRVAMTTRSAVR
jgi:hypothetical protein